MTLALGSQSFTRFNRGTTLWLNPVDGDPVSLLWTGVGGRSPGSTGARRRFWVWTRSTGSLGSLLWTGVVHPHSNRGTTSDLVRRPPGTGLRAFYFKPVLLGPLTAREKGRSRKEWSFSHGLRPREMVHVIQFMNQGRRHIPSLRFYPFPLTGNWGQSAFTGSFNR